MPPPGAPAHTVVVMLENRAYGQVIGRHSAAFLNGLARGGVLFSHSQAITHPSQPNYLAPAPGPSPTCGDDGQAPR